MTTIIVVQNAGSQSVNGKYFYKSADVIPQGFDLVCKQNSWNTVELWNKLNGNPYYFEKDDGAYMYYNKGDRRWWIDEKGGLGVYIADTYGSVDAKKFPPKSGYKTLPDAKLPLPDVEIIAPKDSQENTNDML